MTTRAERAAEVDAILEIVRPLLRAGRQYRIDVRGEQRRLVELEVADIHISFQGLRACDAHPAAPRSLDVHYEGVLMLRVEWNDGNRRMKSFEAGKWIDTLSKLRRSSSFSAMERTMKGEIDDLKSLHNALIDSRAGYKEALADADSAKLKPLFEDMIAMRSSHHRQMDTLLRGLGETPDEGGTFMAIVHRTIIKAQSLFTGVNESILPGLIDGEKRIVGYYDDALGTCPAAAVELLNSQRNAVVDKIADMEMLKVRAGSSGL